MPNFHNARGVKASAEGLKKLVQAKADGRDDDGPLTYERIALAAGVNDRTVRRFMKGEAVDTDTAYPVCQVLKVAPDEILEISEDRIVLDICGQKGPNPFNYGSSVEPDRFYGRWSARADIKNRIGAKTAQSINIVGLRRIGKTSLLRYVRERISEFCPNEQKPLVVSLDFQDMRFHTPEGITEGLRRGIQKQCGTALWERNANEDAYEVEDALLRLRDQGQRLIVMIDEFEGIAKRLDTFQDWGEDWRAKASAGLLTLMMATKRPLNEIYEPLQLTSPFHNIFSTTLLGAMESAIWQKLVNDGFNTQLSVNCLNWLEQVTGGWPFLVQMASSLLWQHGNLERTALEFHEQAAPYFRAWWSSLHHDEQVAIKQILGHGAQEVSTGMLSRLYRYGLIDAKGRIFSSALAEWS